MLESSLIQSTSSWPFVEVRKLLKERKSIIDKKNKITFQTGYGPSGLPHIGTFGEVFRTTMVIKAFKYLSDIPTKLFVFSDEMDGLRKVPQNIPNQNLIFDLPKDIVVEVPAKIGRNGYSGICLESFPSAFGRLLNNQVGLIQLTTDAIFKKSKHVVYQALLADPIVDNPKAASNLLDTMLEVQGEYLGYLT